MNCLLNSNEICDVMMDVVVVMYECGHVMAYNIYNMYVDMPSYTIIMVLLLLGV